MKLRGGLRGKDRDILGVSQRRAKVGLAKLHALATSLYLNLQPGEKMNHEARDPLRPQAAASF